MKGHNLFLRMCYKIVTLHYTYETLNQHIVDSVYRFDCFFLKHRDNSFFLSNLHVMEIIVAVLTGSPACRADAAGSHCLNISASVTAL